ncbi:MAG: nicotinate phosphoribosyltransferase [Gemmatimonadota bacterium]|jgi:nicotinate phosphoribosyltransferase
MESETSALLTDLYQLNMIQGYLDHGETETAVFDLFVRTLPERRAFLVAAGLEPALRFLERLRFTAEDVEWLASTGRFRDNMLDYLASLRFTGDVHAMPEGTVFFPEEPILRVTAPLPEAQLVETRMLNFLHFQSLIASKAARMVLAVSDKTLVDFGLRRAHGAEAGLMAARASYIAGFAGTATVLAEELYGIPSFGTMAHSFVEAHDHETVAFEHFARSRPEQLTLLIDTYDTEEGARKVVALAPRLAADDIRIAAVRLDSGDMIALSRSVRRILDEGGLDDVSIFASGGLDEDRLLEMSMAGAPIDGFGIGTSLVTSSDAPSLDCAYKLQEYRGIPRRKRSEDKATWPGRKQVWRQSGPDGRMERDVLSVETDEHPGEPLLVQVMRNGRVLEPAPSLAEARERCARQLGALPERLRRLDGSAGYPVQVSPELERLAEEVDRRLALAEEVDDG